MQVGHGVRRTQKLRVKCADDASREPSREAKERGWEWRTKRPDQWERKQHEGREARVLVRAEQGTQGARGARRASLDGGEALTHEEDTTQGYDSQVAGALQARAERAEELVATLRAHLHRARVQTRRAEKEAEAARHAVQDEQREMQRQARAGARDLRASQADAERRIKKAEADAKRFFEDGKLLGSMLQGKIDQLTSEMQALETAVATRDEMLAQQERRALGMKDMEAQALLRVKQREQQLVRKEQHLRAASQVASCVPPGRA